MDSKKRVETDKKIISTWGLVVGIILVILASHLLEHEYDLVLGGIIMFIGGFIFGLCYKVLSSKKST